MADTTGRIKQKQRTRQAIVDAAQRLLEAGTVPTVAVAAEAADVRRTTAYRYFPTQDSLLVELAVSSNVADIEELVSAPVSASDARARLLEVIRRLNHHVLHEEVRYRTASRLYIDQWLASHAAGEAEPFVREGRRRRWFTQILTPLMDEHGMKNAERTRVADALSLACGAEPMIVMRDVCRLEGDVALDVAEAVASAILDDAFGPPR
jgi:AcrR family transcriptional regulator